MNPLVSIIVPIYNVEQYLENCLDSLKTQEYSNIEVIMVNDGSVDNSRKICTEYCDNDNRFKLINKKNGGLSDARNAGLNIAKGKYILFVDGDDYVSNSGLGEIVSLAEKSNLQIVSFNGEIINNNIKSKWIHNKYKENVNYTGEIYILEGIKNGYFSAAVCSRMYLKSFLEFEKIDFKKSILHEDENWTPQVLLKADRIMHKDIIFYNYLIRENSITQHKSKIKNIKDLQNTCIELKEVYNSKIENTDSKKYFIDYLSRLYMVSCNLDEKYKLKIEDFNFIKENSLLIKTRFKKLLFLNFRFLYTSLRKMRGI